MSDRTWLLAACTRYDLPELIDRRGTRAHEMGADDERVRRGERQSEHCPEV